MGHVQVSALKGIGFTALSEAIEDTLMKHTDFGAAQMRLLVPYTESKVYAQMPLDEISLSNPFKALYAGRATALSIADELLQHSFRDAILGRDLHRPRPFCQGRTATSR